MQIFSIATTPQLQPNLLDVNFIQVFSQSIDERYKRIAGADVSIRKPQDSFLTSSVSRVFSDSQTNTCISGQLSVLYCENGSIDNGITAGFKIPSELPIM